MNLEGAETAPSGHGFHEKAYLCQVLPREKFRGGIHKGGGSPSCGGSRVHRGGPALLAGAPRAPAWGEPARPGLSPGGGNGKGGVPIPCCRWRLLLPCRSSVSPSPFLILRRGALASFPTSQPPTRPASIRTLWEPKLPCQWVSSISNGCCHLGIELNRFCHQPAVRSAVTSQSPELGDFHPNHNPLCCDLLRCLVPQRLVHLSGHP
jgi:hypothetical protein